MPSRNAMNSGRKIVRNIQHSNNCLTGHPTANNEATSGNDAGSVEQPALGSALVGQLTVVHGAASQGLREPTRDETTITFQNASRNITREQIDTDYLNELREGFEIATRKAARELVREAFQEVRQERRGETYQIPTRLLGWFISRR